MAIMDWGGRYVLAWRLPNSLDGSFCVEALDEALARHQAPKIITTRGASSPAWPLPGRLQKAGIRI